MRTTGSGRRGLSIRCLTSPGSPLWKASMPRPRFHRLSYLMRNARCQNTAPEYRPWRTKKGRLYTPSGQADLAQSSDWKMAKQAGDWQIYELLTHNGSYVYVPEYEPNAIGTKGQDWKKVSLDWWVDIDKTDVPIVFSGDNGFLKAESLGVVKRITIDNKCTIKESVLNEEIDFNTNCVGRPHIIKVSYFPNWHVEGASKIYLVSPSFMLVYPEQENVRLYYADTSGNVLRSV